MSEAHFTNITITGNSATKPPRKDSRSRVGLAQYVFTFSLSGHVKSLWLETFNRVWEERSRQAPAISPPLISDNQIQIICPPDDQLQQILDELKQAFALTNQRYREHLQAADAERHIVDGILQRLRF